MPYVVATVVLGCCTAAGLVVTYVLATSETECDKVECSFLGEFVSGQWGLTVILLASIAIWALGLWPIFRRRPR